MKWLVEQIASPILRRAGTALGAYLLAKEVPAGSVEIIETGIVTGALVALDLAHSWYQRQKRGA